ncbi:MAG: hypothetical protein ACOZNI_09945 [Myxococcota bacterium]
MLACVIFLLACHVFETVAIECVRGEPCARKGDADADTDADTDADADADTGPVLAPAKGFVLSVAAEDGSAFGVLAFDPSGEQVSERQAVGGGPVAYRASEDAFWLGVDTTLYALTSAGTGALDAFVPVLDVELTEGLVWTAHEDDVVSWDPEAATSTGSFATDPGTIVAIGAVGTGVYATVAADGTPDLFDVSVGGAIERHLDFDGSTARAHGVFAGPDGEPFTCSNAGAIYRVSDLVAGDRRPAVFYDGDLADVTDCGWDEGDDSWLIVSASAGVLRLDAQGRGTSLVTPPSGYVVVRGNFY